MGSEDVRNSVAVGIRMLGKYMQQVIDDQGLEKALDYYRRVGYMFGTGNVATFKDRCGKETPSPEDLKEIFTENLTGFGSDFEITARPDGIDMNIGKCAVYQGLSMAGLDNETVTAFCRNAGEGQMAAVTAEYPQLELFHNPKSHEGGICIEGYNIKK